jgi:hypothetical protein
MTSYRTARLHRPSLCSLAGRFLSCLTLLSQLYFRLRLPLQVTNTSMRGGGGSDCERTCMVQGQFSMDGQSWSWDKFGKKACIQEMKGKRVFDVMHFFTTPNKCHCH